MDQNIAGLNQVRATLIDLALRFGPRLFAAAVVLVAGFIVSRGEFNARIAAAFHAAGIGSPVPRQEIRLVGGG